MFLPASKELAPRPYDGGVCRPLAAAVIVFSLALLSFAAKEIRADDSPQSSIGSLEQLSLEQLGNVEITSVSKDPQQVLKTPAAVFVITQQDIERSGATSIPEVLRMAPGVEVARIDGNHWSVAIRGFAGQFSKSLLVLVDGRSIYTPLFEGVYWDLPYVMLEDVERIEVIRGPGGTIWGANAVNGVINIITKNAGSTKNTLATLGGGSVDQGTGAFRYGASIGQDFSYRIYGMGEIRGPEFHADADRFDSWHMGQTGFRTDWNIGEKDSFTVQGDIYRGVSGESILIPSLSPPAETAERGWDYVSGGNLLARWRHTTGEGSDIQIQTYFDRTNRQDFELGETRDTFDLDFVEHLRVHSDQQLTWGLGARISPSHVIQTVAGVNFLPNSQTDTIYSGFGQYELPIVRDKLSVTAGSKLEHNNFSGFEYEPSVRVLWTPTLRQSFWGAVTRSVRTPSRLDQDVVFDIFDEFFPLPSSTPGGAPVLVPVFFQIQGNPKLKSEKLLGYELGYRTQATSKVYVDVTGFYNVYRDLQGYGPAGLLETSSPLAIYFTLPYGNVIQGHTIGAEVAPNWKITNWWQVRGTYSYLHMVLGDRPGFTDVGNLLGTYAESSPGSVGSFQSSFDLPNHVELDATYRYSGILPEYNVPAYSTADLRAGWHLGEGLELSVAGDNLLQPHHFEFGGDPGPLVAIKRSVYAKMTWRR